MRTSLLAALAAAAATGTALAAPAPALPAPAASTRIVADPREGTTFLVLTAPGEAGRAVAARAVTGAGASVVVAWPEIGVTVGLAAEVETPAIVRSVRRVPGVQAAGVSGRVAPEGARAPRTPVAAAGTESPGDIAYGAGALEANRWATGRGVSILVADTGVYDEHSELAGRVDTQRSGSCTNGGVLRRGGGAWRPASPPTSVSSHGTEVASAAAAAVDGHGIRGVAPEATVVALRVVSDGGDISPEASICSAMAAAALGVPVANHSYGVDWSGSLRHAMWDPRDPDQAAVMTAVRRAFAWSRHHGVLNVAATGNGGEDLSDKPSVPLAAYEGSEPLAARTRALLAEVPGVLGVGELAVDGHVAGSSTSGFGVTDIAAVGSGVLATAPGHWEQDAGTSYAAPAVVGAAALVTQVRPHATVEEKEQILLATAHPRGCAGGGELFSSQPCRAKGRVTTFFGAGTLDAAAAVTAARQAR